MPMEVTIKLLENAMRAALESKSKSGSTGWEAGKGRFLIDGFPRKMDQALKFEEDVRADPSAGSFSQSLFACIRRVFLLLMIVRCLGVHVVVGAVFHDE